MTLVAQTAAGWRVLPLSWSGGVLNAEPAGWKDPGFDDSGWQLAEEVLSSDLPAYGFWTPLSDGVPIVPPTVKATPTLDEVVWIARREFELDPFVSATVRTNADGGRMVWLNGALAMDDTIGNTALSPIDITSLVTTGTNVLAVRIGNGHDPAGDDWDTNPSMLWAAVDAVAPTVATAWDVYSPAAPNGAIVVSLENAYARSFRDELNGPGKGSFRINRYAPEVEFLTERSIVKVRIPELGADYVFAFELVDVEATLATAREKGEEEVTFSGPGVLAYLDHAEMLDRAFTTGLDVSDTWLKIWSTGKIPNPVGSCTIDDDPTYLYVISQNRKIYKLRQSDRVVVATSPVLWSGTANTAGGLCADPTDPNILWALETPWFGGSSNHTKIRKIDASGDISTWNVSDTFDLGSAVKLTDIENDATHLWTTKYDGPDLQKRSKVDGSVVDSYSIVYGGTAQVQATGSAINGSQIALFFSGKQRALIADLSDPETITDKISLTGLSAFGGAWRTEGGNDYFYPVSYTSDTVWKYQLTTATPHDPVDGIWRLDEGNAIAIARRLYDEWTDPARPQQPIAAVTVDFGYTTDSNGDANDVVDGVLEYTAAIGDKGLPTVLRLTPYGPTFRMSPYLVWSAYNDFGTDRSSATFASGKVRLERGVNIASDIRRRVNTQRLDTYMLAGGDGHIFAEAELEDVPYVSEGFVSTPLTDATALAGTASAELDQERVRAESVALGILWGDDELAGKYLPYVHYGPGDIARAHTGSGPYDYDEANMQIYAIQVDETLARGWTAIGELQSGYSRKGQPDQLSGGGSTSSGGTGASSGGSTATTRVTLRDGVTGDTAIGTTLESDDIGVNQAGPGVAGFTVKKPELDELKNVDAGGKVDGQGLIWSDAQEAWIPGDVAAAADTPFEHGNLGIDETLDLADSTWHRGTLNAACAISVAGFTVDEAVVMVVRLEQNGVGGFGITWDPDVLFLGDDQPDLTAATVSWFVIWSDAGDAEIYGARVGGGLTSSSFATPAITLGTAAAAGAASTVIRSDAVIEAFDATAPTTSAIGDAAATGAAAVAARRDHKHGREALSTATPLVESGAGAVGTGVKSSREDHVHPAAASSGLTVQEEGSPLATLGDTLNFVGVPVTASGTGSTKTITILREEPHVAYDGTIVLDGNGDPVMVEVA